MVTNEGSGPPHRMANTILVVDDERNIVQLARLYLGNEGFRVEEANDGKTALEKARTVNPDLVILDIMMPEMDGLTVCKEIRKTSNVPVIILTARGDDIDKIVGLEIGADDYVAKPFSPNELVARVRALLRRTQRPPETRDISYGPIHVDTERHVVSSSGVAVALTAKEFLLLEYLLRHRGRVLSRDVLLTDVWGYKYTGGTRTVDVHVRRLREKLPALGDALVTVKQFGYKLLEQPPAV